MAKTIIQLKCPFCGKVAKEKSQEELDGDIWVSLECGHTIISESFKSIEDKEWEKLLLEWKGKSNFTPFPYQVEGVKFAEAAGCNALILDEQGLGKTIQEAMILKRNPQLLPCLGVVKSGLRAQWFKELFKIVGIPAQIITSSKEVPYFDFFQIVLVSIDTLRLLRPDIKEPNEFEKMQRQVKGKKEKSYKPVWTDEMCARFKHVFVDEIQKVKNPGSARTQALRKIISLANDGEKASVIGLSGTPIDKHAGEFFVALNLVNPLRFPSESTYQLQYCKTDPETGKIGGLKNPDRFREATSDFIIRRLRAEVMPELPKMFRQFKPAELEGGELEAYKKIVKEFQEYMSDEDQIKVPTDILGYLSRMRHITGIAKVNAAAEFVEEFLLETEGTRKLTIFLHHQQAAQFLMAKLEQLCKDGGYAPPLYLKGGMTLNARVAVEEDFRSKPECKILVASTLASCEGLNLQFCTDCLFMERQWNPTTEEQAESRFPRPRPDDPWPADARINAVYLIAAGTIDDFLTDIVEFKRQNVKQVLDGEEIIWNEASLVMELAKVLQTKGLAKWRL